MLDITAAQVKAKEYDLKHWPEGKSPNEIAIRITEKFLKTPHTRIFREHTRN